MAISGSSLALYYRAGPSNYVPFAAATSCSFTSTTAQIDVTNYDSDWFRDYKNDIMDWSVTTDGLITIGSLDYKDLLDLQLNRSRIVVYFSTIEYYTIFYGRGYVTNITIGAPVEGVATYSATVTGAGPFSFTDPTTCLRFLITLTTAGSIEWVDCDDGSLKSIATFGPATFYQCAQRSGGLNQIFITSGTGTITSSGYCTQ